MASFIENIKKNIGNLQKKQNPYETMNLSFEDYVSYVTSLARRKSSLMFHNKGVNHAKVVLSNIFALSSKKIYWFSGCLNKDVLDNSILSAILDFLQKNGEIHIVLEEIDPAKTDLTLMNLLKLYEKTGIVKMSLTKKKFNFNGNNAHFLIGDDIMYRIEKDIQNYEADFCFNDPETALSLKNEFFKLTQP